MGLAEVDMWTIFYFLVAIHLLHRGSHIYMTGLYREYETCYFAKDLHGLDADEEDCKDSEIDIFLCFWTIKNRCIFAKYLMKLNKYTYMYKTLNFRIENYELWTIWKLDSNTLK